MGITTKEIAKICGVSRTTVHRALNNTKYKPKVNTTRNKFQVFARGNNRTNNWNIYTYG